MSLQIVWSVLLAHPATSVNGLALFLALAGSWLWLMTRLRERRSLSRLLGTEGYAAATDFDGRTLRINRFFYRFGGACLTAALMLSWMSARL